MSIELTFWDSLRYDAIPGITDRTIHRLSQTVNEYAVYLREQGASRITTTPNVSGYIFTISYTAHMPMPIHDWLEIRMDADKAVDEAVRLTSGR